MRLFHVTFTHLPLPHVAAEVASPSSEPDPVTLTSQQVSKFCEFHSRHAAYHLAHNVQVFMRDHSLHPPLNQSHFLDKFLEGTCIYVCLP